MDSACSIILYHLFFVSPSRRKWNYTYDKYLQVTSTGSYRSSKNDQIKQCSIYHVQWRNANKGQFIWLLNYWILVNPSFPSPLQESLLESWNQDPKANKLLKHMNPRPTPMLMWSVYDSMPIYIAGPTKPRFSHSINLNLEFNWNGQLRSQYNVVSMRICPLNVTVPGTIKPQMKRGRGINWRIYWFFTTKVSLSSVLAIIRF